MSFPELETILHPRSVAVVGASANPFSFGYSFAHHMKEFGFQGPIYLVNPTTPEILGIKTYPGVREIPGKVDFAISCVNASQVPAMLEDLAEKEVRCVHLYTARFSETGRQEAADLEQEVLHLARSKGIRLIGPNCMGVYHPQAGLSFGFNLPKDSGPVGMISQSGGGASGFIHLAALRGIRFSKVISYGNGLDLTECDYLDYFIEDQETEIILLYVEGVKDGRRFFDTLSRAARVKPVVVMKGGRGEAGSRMTFSHTASLAGSAQVWKALIKQTGAVSADDFDELLDLTVAFRFLPRVKGKRVGVIGGGGGPSVIAAEECEESGLEVIPIPEDMRRELKERGVSIWDWISNPVDLSIVAGSGVTDIDMLHLMGQHPDFDILMANVNEWVFMTLASDERFQGLKNQANNYILLRDSYKKPFVVIFGERGVIPPDQNNWQWQVIAEARAELLQAGMATFPTFRRAAKALYKAQEYYSCLDSRPKKSYILNFRMDTV
jgi:acyl-CoA synthetase (NDP forming)